MAKKVKKKKYLARHLYKRHGHLSIFTFGRDVDWFYLLLFFILALAGFSLHAYSTYTNVTSGSSNVEIVTTNTQFDIDEEKISMIQQDYIARAEEFSSRNAGKEFSLEKSALPVVPIATSTPVSTSTATSTGSEATTTLEVEN